MDTSSIYEIAEKEYFLHFSNSENPYISHQFINHNLQKIDRIICLVNSLDTPDIGIVLAVKENQLLSPFSAPFGGFHSRHEAIYSNVVDDFLRGLKQYFLKGDFSKISLVLPPDIYSKNMNAKLINTLFRLEYHLCNTEITNHIDLSDVGIQYAYRNAREYYNQAVRHGLKFEISCMQEEFLQLYEVAKDNRVRMGRPIYMSADDLLNMKQIWPVDSFAVKDNQGKIASAALFYRAHPSIAQAVLWGDTADSRHLRAMDFMILNLCFHYKKIGFKAIDLGISTESGNPNNGLLRFKEIHESRSTIRYSFELTRQ